MVHIDVTISCKTASLCSRQPNLINHLRSRATAHLLFLVHGLLMYQLAKNCSVFNTADLSDWEKMILRGEIEKAVEDVIARIEG